MTWNSTIAKQGDSNRRRGGFTLVEALVAMLFMVVVIPVALGAVRVAGMAGEAAQRKMVAARVATKVINQLRIENRLQSGQRGSYTEDGVTYSWSQQTEFWTGDPVSRMYMTTITVEYKVSGHSCNVQMSTLVPPAT